MRIKLTRKEHDAINELQLLRWRAYEITESEEFNIPRIFPIQIALGEQEYTPVQKKLHAELDKNYARQTEIVRWLHENSAKELVEGIMNPFGHNYVSYWTIPIHFSGSEIVIVDD